MDLLANACYVVIGYCIIMYVLLDGFDLGIGLLFPFANSNEKDVMMSAILPVWDGNQTWLVLGVATLYGAFPHAFSLLLPALYLPLLLMVVALLLRGITFEFRLKEHEHRIKWDILFFTSSLVITFCQGLLVGAFVSGFTITPKHELVINIITPFTIFCGFALIAGYALLGATWVIGKTEAELNKRMYYIARILLYFVAFALVIVSLWSPFINTVIWHTWFNINNYFLFILPLITAFVIYYFDYSLKKRNDYLLYWLTVAIFLCCYFGFVVSTWGYLIPYQVTIWQASAPPSSQIFLLIGALLLLPVLVGYTSYAYYIFRGKIKTIIGYD